jgi:hypothetical protein
MLFLVQESIQEDLLRAHILEEDWFLKKIMWEALFRTYLQYPFSNNRLLHNSFIMKNKAVDHQHLNLGKIHSLLLRSGLSILQIALDTVEKA